MMRLTTIALATLALWPATASAYQSTLTVREARTYLEELNERVEERVNETTEIKRCHKVSRLRVDCTEIDWCGPTAAHCAEERIDEVLNRITVTPRNRLKDSPIVLRWFF
jgi:hypothetical protein